MIFQAWSNSLPPYAQEDLQAREAGREEREKRTKRKGKAILKVVGDA